MKQPFNPARRKSLKLISGVAASGLLSGLVSSASVFASGKSIHAPQTGSGLSARLIVRADNSRAHMLLQNPANKDIYINRFDSFAVRFDSDALNLSDAFVEPVRIPAGDRVMVRLDMQAGLYNGTTAEDLSSVTQHLPLGTRVVPVALHVHRGIAYREQPLV